jgi:hypothetical protein
MLKVEYFRPELYFRFSSYPSSDEDKRVYDSESQLSGILCYNIELSSKGSETSQRLSLRRPSYSVRKDHEPDKNLSEGEKWYWGKREKRTNVFPVGSCSNEALNRRSLT